MHSGGPKSSPQACLARTLVTEPSAQPGIEFFKQRAFVSFNTNLLGISFLILYLSEKCHYLAFTYLFSF